MVDYFPVLERAVASLNPNTKEARAALYDRARRAMVDGLRKSDPTLSDTDLGKQTGALEDAIRRLEEAQDAAPAARGPFAPPPVAAPSPAAVPPQAPPRPAPPVQPPPPRTAADAAPPVTVAPPSTGAAPRAAPTPVVEPRHEQPPELPDEDYQDRPPLDDERKPWRLIAASVAAVVLIAGGVAVWSFWPSKSTTRTAVAPTPPAQRGTPAKRVEADAAGAAPYVYLRQPVYYRTTHPVGTIVVDKQQSFLYVVRPSVSALRYGIGVGPDCVTSAGLYQIVRKEEWPGLKPAGGKPVSDEERTKNPFGARALYLSSDGRIHGTNTPSSIGRLGSLGCFRLTNDDVIYLYERSPLETRVVVLN